MRGLGSDIQTDRAVEMVQAFDGNVSLTLQGSSIGVHFGPGTQHSDVGGVAGNDRFQYGFIQAVGRYDDGAIPIDLKALHRLLDRLPHMERPGIGKAFAGRILRPGFDHFDPEPASRSEAGDLFIHMPPAKQQQAALACNHIHEKLKRSTAGMTVGDGQRDIHMGAFSFSDRCDRFLDHRELGDPPADGSDRTPIFFDDHVGVAPRCGADAFGDRHEGERDIPILQIRCLFKYVHTSPRQVPARTAVIRFLVRPRRRASATTSSRAASL